MSNEITIDPGFVEVAQNIFSEFVALRPEHSFSFSLTDQGVGAISEAKKLADWGIGGNKPKLKETALDCLDVLEEANAGDPVNVNFTEYEIKAMSEVLSVIEKALDEHEDGVLSK